MANEEQLDAIVLYDSRAAKGAHEQEFHGETKRAGNPAGYFFGEFVEKVERQLIPKKDDPFYQVSSTIANNLVKDRTVGSMFALGIYSVLTSIGGNKK